MKKLAIHKAKEVKNNEFYTQEVDIEKMLLNAADFLKDKTIYFNCDSINSNFYKVINRIGASLGIKDAYFTHYEPTLDKISIFDLEADNSVKNYVIYIDFENGESGESVFYYEGLGDFRSEYCVGIAKKCDVVITNPPFSLMREFIDIIYKKLKKDILIVANILTLQYKNTYEFFINRKINIVGNLNYFLTPSGEIKDIRCYWISTLPIAYELKEFKFIQPQLTLKRIKEYNAINIDKFKNIIDVKDYLAVPITLCEYNFEKYFQVVDLIAPTLQDGTNLFSKIIIKRK